MPLYPIILEAGKLRQASGADTIFVSTISSNWFRLLSDKAISFGNDDDAYIFYSEFLGQLYINPKNAGTGALKILGNLYAENIFLLDNEKLYLGTVGDASIHYSGSHLIITPDIVGSGEVQVAGTLRCEKLRIGADVSGYTAFAFTVLDAAGGIIFRRDHTTEEAFVYLSNNTANSGGQMRGLVGGGLKFANYNGVGYGVYVNANGLDCYLGAANPHIRLRGGSGGALSDGRQIQMSYSATLNYTHGICTRHDSGTAIGNAIDFWTFKYGTDASDVTIGTNRAFIMAGDALRIPNDNYPLLFGGSGLYNDGDASIYYNGTNLIINPKVVGTGAVEITGDTYFSGAGSGLPCGEIYAYNVGTTIAIAGTGIANKVQVTAFDTDGVSNLMTPDHTNDHITIVKTGTYLVTVSTHAESTGGTAYTMGLIVCKNNGATLLTNLHAHRSLSGGGGDTGSISISGLVSLTAADTIEVWCYNDTNTNDIIIDDMTLSITMVGA